MLTKSAKAKSRRLQDAVCNRLEEYFGEKLEPGDIRPALMGESGEDLKRSPLARKLLPFSFECKNQEKLNIWSALEQAQANCSNGDSPAVVFKRNRSETYIALKFDDFINLLGDKNG